MCMQCYQHLKKQRTQQRIDAIMSILICLGIFGFMGIAVAVIENL